MTPHARQDRLVVQELGDETIIYDEQRDHVHRLNPTAAVIWRHCDGQHTISDLVGILQAETQTPVTDEVVWLALDRLEKERLLQERLVRPEDAPQITRRQMLRKAALAGGVTLLLPVVQSMAAPTPAMAMSVGCAKRNQSYSMTRPCCPGLVQGTGAARGRCVGRGNR